MKFPPTVWKLKADFSYLEFDREDQSNEQNQKCKHLVRIHAITPFRAEKGNRPFGNALFVVYHKNIRSTSKQIPLTQERQGDSSISYTNKIRYPDCARDVHSPR